jgi:hypothetical protein
MEIINLGKADGLPPVDWATVADKLEAGSAPDPVTAPFNAPSQGPPWNVYRIEPRSATVVLGVEPGGLTRFRF